MPAQQVILYAVATLALSAWAWRYYLTALVRARAGVGRRGRAEIPAPWPAVQAFTRNTADHRFAVVLLARFAILLR